MVTQKDIARRVRVSQALVSRALAGTANRIGASAVTVRRILDMASRMDYRPSAAAQTLRGGPSHTLGVIIKNFDDPFIGRLIAELRGVARLTHHSLVLAGYDPAEGDPSDALSLTRHRLDRLVLCGSDFPHDLVLRFVKAGVHVTQIGVSRAIRGVPLIRVDEADGFGCLVGYLKGLGHTRVGFLGTDSPLSDRRGRILKQSLKKAGLPVCMNWFVIQKTASGEGGYQAIKQIASRAKVEMPTALVAAEDVIAQGALRALHEEGLSVPKDMSLAGFDDIPSAAMMIPALTSVRQPIRELVQMAWTLLENKTRSDTLLSGVLVKPELIVRESCGKPRSA